MGETNMNYIVLKDLLQRIQKIEKALESFDQIEQILSQFDRALLMQVASVEGLVKYLMAAGIIKEDDLRKSVEQALQRITTQMREAPNGQQETKQEAGTGSGEAEAKTPA